MSRIRRMSSGDRPDWNADKKESITSPYTVTKNGYVIGADSVEQWMAINGVEVSRGGFSGVNHIKHTQWVQVSVGDVVTFGGTAAFYPCK